VRETTLYNVKFSVKRGLAIWPKCGSPPRNNSSPLIAVQLHVVGVVKDATTDESG